MQNQKGNIVLMIVGIVAILAIGGGVGYFVAKKPVQKEEMKDRVKERVQKQEQKTQQEVEKDETADWKIYRNDDYGFEMKYPKEFTQRENASSIIFENARGHISLYVNYSKFDPQNVQDIYGKVDNPVLVKVGDRDGYQYRTGDAGCAAVVTQAELGSNTTLNIAFGSCNDGTGNPIINSVDQDKDLIVKILSTFKFVNETADWKTESLNWVKFKIPADYKLVAPSVVSSNEGFVLKGLNRSFSFYRIEIGRGGPPTDYLIRYDGKIENKRMVLSNRRLERLPESGEPFFVKGATAVIATVTDGKNTYTIIDEGMGDYKSVEKLFLEIIKNIEIID